MAATAQLPIRFSHLRAFGRSAAHGQLARSGAEDDPTYSMEKGTAVHAILFGTRKVVGYHAGRPRSGKDWQAFQAEHAECEILTASDYELASRMAEAVARHHDAETLLRGPGVVNEQTLRWLRTGRVCRATPDARKPGAYNAELKTTADASPRAFWFHARRMAYHAQLAWQAEACEQTGRPSGRPSEHYIVAVEQKPPHVVQCYVIGPRMLQEGAKLCHLWFERLCASEDANAYPGYSEMILPLELEEEWAADGAEAA